MAFLKHNQGNPALLVVWAICLSKHLSVWFSLSLDLHREKNAAAREIADSSEIVQFRAKGYQQVNQSLYVLLGVSVYRCLMSIVKRKQTV